jgi:hypothetical protein
VVLKDGVADILKGILYGEADKAWAKKLDRMFPKGENDKLRTLAYEDFSIIWKKAYVSGWIDSLVFVRSRAVFGEIKITPLKIGVLNMKERTLVHYIEGAYDLKDEEDE